MNYTETITLQAASAGSEAAAESPGAGGRESSRERHVSALLPSLGLVLAFFFSLAVYGGQGEKNERTESFLMTC